MPLTEFTSLAITSLNRQLIFSQFPAHHGITGHKNRAQCKLTPSQFTKDHSLTSQLLGGETGNLSSPDHSVHPSAIMPLPFQPGLP